MTSEPQIYPMEYYVANNVWLTYGKPASSSIYLFTMPTKTLQKLGIKKGMDIVAHWAICINGYVFELGKTGQKKPRYEYRRTEEPNFAKKRRSQEKDIMYGNIGNLALPYTVDQIHAIAQLVWSLTLKEKYIYDEYNCQVFIRLLVEIIGDQTAKANFPAFLDKWVKGAQNTRDGGSFAFAAGATLIAAGLTTFVVDGGATAAAGFAIAAQTTLRASAWLLTERDNRAKKIKEGQKKVKKRMREDRLPVAEY